MASPDRKSSAFDITLSMTTGSDHRRITLEAGRKVEIGRASRSENRHAVAAPDNALFDCPVISRTHAELAYHPLAEPGTEVNIKDLNSKHGTILNGKKLTAGVHYDLHAGDKIKFGGPITVGAENHDGITMVYSPALPSPQSKDLEAMEARVIQRGFRAPSYESDNDGADNSIDYNSEFDEDHEDGEEDMRDEEDDNDDFDDEEEDDDDDDDDDIIKESDDDNVNDEEELNDSTSQTTPESPKVHPSSYLKPSTMFKFQLDPEGANMVAVPDCVGESAPANPYRREPSNPEVNPHAIRSTFWSNESLRDIIQRCRPPQLAGQSEISEDESDESLWADEPNKPDVNKIETHNFNTNVRDDNVSVARSGIPYPLQPTDNSNQTYYNTKPRYDPVRGSTAAMVDQFPSFPTGVMLPHGSGFVPDSSHAFPVIPQQSKNDYMPESQAADPFSVDLQRHALGSEVPSSTAPQTANVQDPCPLPAVDDVVQSFAWMDQPNPPMSFNKIPIPTLVEQPEKESNRVPEPITEQEPQTVPNTIEKRDKRKADEIEGEAAPEDLGNGMVKKARTEAQQTPVNRYGLVKGMFIGAVGGAIGTMAFLASPATDVLLDWLEV